MTVFDSHLGSLQKAADSTRLSHPAKYHAGVTSHSSIPVPFAISFLHSMQAMAALSKSMLPVSLPISHDA